MTKKNDCTFNSHIAEEKETSVEVVLEKFRPTNDSQFTQMIADVQPIVRQQRVPG